MKRERYRVKSGYTYGARRQHRSGAIVELTQHEAAGVLDKLGLVVLENDEAELEPAGDNRSSVARETDTEDAVGSDGWGTLDADVIDLLNGAGVASLAQAQAMENEALLAVDRLGPATLAKIRAA